MQHLFECVDHWSMIQNFSFDASLEDSIVWNLTPHGEYTAKSAYRAQFFGAPPSDMGRLVWKVWAPQIKTKLSTWLALQNCLWMDDRLAHRGWPNCGLCPLCKAALDTVDHLLHHCRFSLRVWSLLRGWLGLNLDQSNWRTLSLKAWWQQMSGDGANSHKALASLVMLTSWEIWNERNTRVFRNKHASSQGILSKIKHEA